ncbi:MAG: exodeoxyribonuclease VII small subunit [Gammaproteobacteria bacterium]|nr:exodeoxyribonuclease VII small subunit [Gammaproteobacteria bacterium]|tara:strand:+ start:360 stop:596 length:237 start_codon:yes stop_codon:yes gene_type:complete
MAKDTAQTPDFESALAELEDLVEQLESGELPLEESLKAFEKGIALTRHCQNALKAAELKVKALTENDELVDLDPEAPA